MENKTTITLDEVLGLARCVDYPDERIRELFGEKTEATAQDILTDIRLPDSDKVWLICYGGFLSKTLSVELARFCADNARRWAAERPTEWAARAAERAAAWAAERAEWAEWAEWAPERAEWAEWAEWAPELAARAAERAARAAEWASERTGQAECAAQVKFLSEKLK